MALPFWYGVLEHIIRVRPNTRLYENFCIPILVIVLNYCPICAVTKRFIVFFEFYVSLANPALRAHVYVIGHVGYYVEVCRAFRGGASFIGSLVLILYFRRSKESTLQIL